MNGTAGKDGRKRLGKRGEDLAAAHLISLGHTILERNCHKGHLEIDIISLAPDGIHFVEVKSRTAPSAEDPRDCVNPLKQKRLAAAASRYLATNPYGEQAADCEVHFDIAAVTFDGEEARIEYIPEAFIPVYF